MSPVREAWHHGLIGRALVLGPYVLLVLVMFLGFHDIEATRTRNDRALCSAFQAFTNSLIAASKPSTPLPPDQAKQVAARVHAFGDDLNRRLAPLGCHLQLIDP